jgi:hypothetical protein
MEYLWWTLPVVYPACLCNVWLHPSQVKCCLFRCPPVRLHHWAVAVTLEHTGGWDPEGAVWYVCDWHANQGQGCIVNTWQAKLESFAAAVMICRLASAGV